MDFTYFPSADSLDERQRVPLGEEQAFSEMCEGLGYTYTDESENKIYTDFMR